MDLIAVGEGLGPKLVRRARLEVNVLRGAQGLQGGVLKVEMTILDRQSKGKAVNE